MDKRTQILVIGHNESGCTANHEKIAYDTGAKIAMELGMTDAGQALEDILLERK